jgi:hypothetical protein
VGRIYSITPSFALANTGDWDAVVEAAFDSQSLHLGANEYGLIGNTDALGAAVYIPGTEFALEAFGLGGAATGLTDTGVDKIIPPNLPCNSTCYDYDAHLDVPAGAAQDIYAGNVVLTFSNV